MSALAEEFFAGRSFADLRTELDEQGYLVFESVLNSEQVAAVRAALQPFLDQNLTGRNDFEGLKSNRVYGLLAKGSEFVDLALHPLALAFAEAELGESCLLSACLAINLHPGETVQPWHTDDGHIDLPRPRPSFGLSAFWAFDDTTESNGATEVLPGSHTWRSETIDGSLSDSAFSDITVRDVGDDQGSHPDAIKVTLKAGSLMLAKSGLWHRGGNNYTETSRLIITPQYCVGWARQLENMLIAVPPDIAAGLPKRAQELIGYSIHPPFMGYVDGSHPAKRLPSA
ncbi:MAG: phytanoyl-CoA dioxygenase family protein [Pseudomonadales bacterium]